VNRRIDTLQAAVQVGHELLALLQADDVDGDAIRSLLSQRRELIASCDPTDFSGEERAIARALVELDDRIVARCEERSRVVASTLCRVRQRATTSAPGRVLTDLA
jgi:hypothetical protein